MGFSGSYYSALIISAFSFFCTTDLCFFCDYLLFFPTSIYIRLAIAFEHFSILFYWLTTAAFNQELTERSILVTGL